MRTLKRSLVERLRLQTKEAALLGFKKTASDLNEVLDENSFKVRESDEGYTYDSVSLVSDVEKNLWSATLRLADFYDSKLDIKVASELVEKFAEDLMLEFRNKFKHVNVGAHEPNVPGEKFEKVMVEVED